MHFVSEVTLHVFCSLTTLYRENKNFEKEHEYLIKASTFEKCPPQILFNLANSYVYGRGSNTDFEKAIELYEKLVNLNMLEAINNLGAFYLQGPKGFPKDVEKARNLLERAAKMGCKKALKNLLIMNHNKENVIQNISVKEEKKPQVRFEYFVSKAESYNYLKSQEIPQKIKTKGISQKNNPKPISKKMDSTLPIEPEEGDILQKDNDSIILKAKEIVNILKSSPNIHETAKKFTKGQKLKRLCYGNDSVELWSVRVNDKYRVTFTLTENKVGDFKLSNHYGNEIEVDWEKPL